MTSFNSKKTQKTDKLSKVCLQSAITLFENQFFPQASDENAGLAGPIGEHNFCQTLMEAPPDFGSKIKTKSSPDARYKSTTHAP